MISKTVWDVLQYSLMKAVRGEYTSVVEYLMTFDIDMSVKCQNGWNALHIAARNNRSTENISLLIPKTDINCQTCFGATPLDLVRYNVHETRYELSNVMRMHGRLTSNHLQPRCLYHGY